MPSSRAIFRAKSCRAKALGRAGATWGLMVLTLLWMGCASQSHKLKGPMVPTLSEEPLPGSDRHLPSEVNHGLAPLDSPTLFSYGNQRSAQENRTGDSRRNERTEAADSREVLPVSPRPTPLPKFIPKPGDEFYSVQLLVVASLQTAKEWQASAAEDLGAPVRIDHEHGLYKVRVGMTPRREVADELRRTAVVRGFEDAFLVSVTAPAGR